MKIALVTVALAVFSQLAPAADTAYSALRVVGREQGEAALNRVLELRGRFGAPQPQLWKITTQDPGSRGGLQETEVQGGKIVARRSPVGRAAGTPMNFNQLNLDSEGVFTIANGEAQKSSVAFDRVDYVLRSGTQGGAPVWTVELYEGRHGRVGTFDIAADSGTILRQQLENAGQPHQDVVRGDQEFLRQQDDPDAQYEEHRGEGMPGFFDRLGKRFKKRGRQFENFFTGRGWRDQ